MRRWTAVSKRISGLGALCLVSSCVTGTAPHPEAAVPSKPGHEPPELSQPREASTATTDDLFAGKIGPLLAARCQPCHFPGGVMYERLPFDQPETVRKLGTKLFSRIQDEEQRQWIRDFLDRETALRQPPSEYAD